jgi:hypothetical protein
MRQTGGFGRRARLVAPVALAVGFMSVALTGTSGASAGRAFTATAEASGMFLRYSLPGFLPVENYIDSGGPVSQAVVSSDGVAQAFSSLPYPGSTAIGAPGVFALVTSGAFVPPGYPFYVYADYPTHPEQKLSDPSGAYSLKASAKEGQATGDSHVAPPGGDAVKPVAEASSNVVYEGEQVTATAVSAAQAISVGPLSIGEVRSQSVTTYKNGDAKPTSTTKLTLEGGRAGDTAFSFGPQGLQVAQQGIPVPAGQGLAAINQAISPAGLSIRFADPRALEGGEQAAALEITSVAQVPGAGVGTFRARLGGAMSFISLGGAEASLGDNIVGGTANSGDTSGSTPAGSSPPADGPSVGTGTGSTGDSTTLDAGGLSSAGLSSASGTGAGSGSYDAGTAGASGPDSSLTGGFGAGAGGSTAGTGALLGGATAAPAQLAASPGTVHATSNLATLLVGAVMAGMGLVGVWLWTKGRPAWTV